MTDRTAGTSRQFDSPRAGRPVGPQSIHAEGFESDRIHGEEQRLSSHLGRARNAVPTCCYWSTRESDRRAFDTPGDIMDSYEASCRFTASVGDPVYDSPQDPVYSSYEASSSTSYINRCCNNASMKQLGTLLPGTSTVLSSSRSGTSLIERITRGRIGTRRARAGAVLRLRTSAVFMSPRVVRAQAHCVLKTGFSRSNVHTSHPKAKLAQEEKKAGEAVRGMFGAQKSRRVRPDLFLDNYRKHSPSSMNVKESPKGGCLTERYYAALSRGSSSRKSLSLRFASPIKIIGRTGIPAEARLGRSLYGNTRGTATKRGPAGTAKI